MPRKKSVPSKKKKVISENIEVNESPKREIDVKSLLVFGAIFLLVMSGAFYYFYSNGKKEQTYETPSNAIVVNGVEFPFRNNISNFSSVEVFPNDLHVAYAVFPRLDYYQLEWSQSCEEEMSCGIISLAGIDISRVIKFSYLSQTGIEDYSIEEGNSSLRVYLNKDAKFVTNKSNLVGLEVVLITPGTTNETKISSYSDENINRIVIEGDTEENFLRAVDQFNYLVLRRLKGEL